MATEAEVAAAQVAEQGNQQQTPPAEDPAAEAAKLREENEKLKKQYEEIRKVETRNSQEIARLKKQGTSNTDDNDDSEEAQKRRTDQTYLKGLGFMSNEDIEEEMNRREAAREQERQVHARAQQIKADMEQTTEKYKFVDKSELLDYMKQRPGLSVMEAAKLKYESEFDKLKNLGDVNAPETDTTAKGGLEAPKRRMVSFKDRGRLSQAVGETAKQAAAIE